MSQLMNDNPLASRPPSHDALVPSGYAEKAMASLLQLHGELMEEKERRVDLYRRLMEKEQSIAELKMYVKMLEEKLKAKEPEPAPAPAPVQVSAPVEDVAAPLPKVQTAPLPGPSFPPTRPTPARRTPLDLGWKSW